MDKLLFLFIVIMFGQIASAQTSEIKAYIEKYKSIALKQEKNYGIPASITLAQGILESAAGTSRLAKASNNHFGIKRGIGWLGPCVYFWDDEKKRSAFRKYNSVAESYEDHVKFLKNNSRYRNLFEKSVYDYRGWAYGLQRAGYATSPTYAKALIGYIEAYQLYSYNGGVKIRQGKTTVITKTITVEEIIEDPEMYMQEEVCSEEEMEVETMVNKMGLVIDINGLRCTILYPGETLSSIAMKYDISKEKILEYNESTNEKDFREGDIIFLEKKRKKYYGSKDVCHAKKGESIYQISQQYGIRLANLCKMNRISLFSPLTDGQKIILK